jgi:HSP20 family protein
MPIFRWGNNFDPMQGFRWLQRELDRLTEWPRGMMESQRLGGGSYPPINVYNGEDEMVVMAEVAGVEMSDLNLSITGETLILKGIKKPSADEETVQFHRRERGSGEFLRTVILPDKVEADRVSARLVNGVLTIRLPKSEAAKPKQIAVQS